MNRPLALGDGANGASCLLGLALAFLLVCVPACFLPGSQVDAVGSVIGEVHLNSEWLVVVGEAQFTVTADLGAGVMVSFPVSNATADGWTAVRLSDRQVYTGSLGDPLPDGALK